MNDRPVLLAREGMLFGERWTIDQDHFIIGRGSDCAIILVERQVSRHHAVIDRHGSRFILNDLESKNGTHLNGTPVHEPTSLKDGDEIQIALCVKLLYVGTDATMPLGEIETILNSPLKLDMSQRSVSVYSRELDPPLSPAQYRLLEALHLAQGAVVSRDEIVSAVWPGTEGLGVSEQAIDALVRRLRERLLELNDHEFVVTVRGHGFRLDNRASTFPDTPS